MFDNPFDLIIGSCFSESTLAGVRIEIDGVDHGSRTIKLESILGELEQILKLNTDPIEFMCQVESYPIFNIINVIGILFQMLIMYIIQFL